MFSITDFEKSADLMWFVNGNITQYSLSDAKTYSFLNLKEYNVVHFIDLLLYVYDLFAMAKVLSEM